MSKFEMMLTDEFLSNYIDKQYHELIDTYEFSNESGSPHLLTLKDGLINANTSEYFIDGKLKELNIKLSNVRKLEQSDLEKLNVVLELKLNRELSNGALATYEYIVHKQKVIATGSIVYTVTKKVDEVIEIIGIYYNSDNATKRLHSLIRI